jgi:hypothetical protein
MRTRVGERWEARVCLSFLDSNALVKMTMTVDESWLDITARIKNSQKNFSTIFKSVQSWCMRVAVRVSGPTRAGESYNKGPITWTTFNPAVELGPVNRVEILCDYMDNFNPGGWNSALHGLKVLSCNRAFDFYKVLYNRQNRMKFQPGKHAGASCIKKWLKLTMIKCKRHPIRSVDLRVNHYLTTK